MPLSPTKQATLFGHPAGLFTLFFSEMWERFSYYGMRAILIFYMLKGFLGYGDDKAYAVYGAYTALVYMTPFFGGMLADRLLGPRRAVILGGLLMAAGHWLMEAQNETLFFAALALIICGNGFFKPNISTMVGALYAQGSPRRDSGFTIFYIGINLGAALAPLLCGYVGETYGYEYGFRLAAIGMLVGLGAFWMPTRLTQILIIGAAALTALLMVWTQADSHWVPLTLYVLIAVALLASAVIAFTALSRGGVPDQVGRAPDEERLRRPVFGIPAEYLVYLGVAAAVPFLAYLVAASAGDPLFSLGDGEGLLQIFAEEISKPAGLILTLAGILALVYLVKDTVRMERVPRERMYVALILIFFNMLFWAFFEQAGSSINTFTDRNVDRVLEDTYVTEADVGKELDVFLTQEQFGYASAPVAAVHGALTARVTTALGAYRARAQAGGLSEDEKKEFPLTLTPSDLLGEAQGQKSVVDCFSWMWAEKVVRNDKEKEARADLTREREFKLSVPKEDKDKPRTVEEQALALVGSPLITMDKLTAARERAQDRSTIEGEEKSRNGVVIRMPMAAAHVGMALATEGQEIPASTFQSVNPTFILIFGLVFTALWAFLAVRGKEPSTPFKFALGLLQLGLGFVALWYGAQNADGRGMVSIGWLVLGYLLHTTGELCLSPVGLSMITKLSPARLVSTMMGMWFLVTGLSNLLAGIIAQLTGVKVEGGGSGALPPPTETIGTYGKVFGGIGIAGIACAAVCFVLVPLLKKWMHEDITSDRIPPADHMIPEKRP